MTRVITRHGRLFTDDVIGRVIETADGWTYESAGDDRSPLEWFGSETEAEDALRALADRTRGEHIVAAGFVALVAAQPVLYVAGTLG